MNLSILIYIIIGLVVSFNYNIHHGLVSLSHPSSWDIGHLRSSSGVISFGFQASSPWFYWWTPFSCAFWIPLRDIFWWYSCKTFPWSVTESSLFSPSYLPYKESLMDLSSWIYELSSENMAVQRIRTNFFVLNVWIFLMFFCCSAVVRQIS